MKGPFYAQGRNNPPFIGRRDAGHSFGWQAPDPSKDKPVRSPAPSDVETS